MGSVGVPDEVQSRPSRLETQLRWHVMALGVVVVAIWPLLHLGTAFISDEGSYVTQARALGAGGWDVGYAFEDADPTGRYVPFHGTVRSAAGTFVYVSHPLWPATLAGAAAIVGEDIGFRVPGVLALVAVCAVAWAIARSLSGPRAGPWGFWFAAASPTLANAWITWAHAPAAAAGGLTVLGVLRARTDPRWLVAAGLGSGFGALLRSESVLWSVAVAAGVVLVDRSRRALRDGAVVVGVAGLAFLAEGAWSDAILGPAGETLAGDLGARGSGASASDRLQGLRLATLDGAFASSAGKLLGVLSVVLVLVAVVAIRRGRGPQIAVWALPAAAVALALRILVAPGDPIPGLALAAPVLLVALLWPVRSEHRWLIGSVGLFVVALGATIYPDGGSVQWGGRFLSPLVCPLAAMAAAGLVAHLPAVEVPRARDAALAFGVVALLVVQGLGAVLVPDQVRKDGEAPVARVVGAGPDVLIAKGGQFARLDLDGWSGRCWIATPEDSGAAELRAVLGALGDSGVARATYVGFERAEVVAAGATIDRALPGLTAGVLSVPGPSRAGSIASPYSCTGR